MIIICSSNDDLSTHFVMEWLIHYEKEVIRISETDIFKLSKVQITNECFDFQFSIDSRFGKKEISLSQITSFWFRRGSINLNWIRIDNNDTILDKSVVGFFCKQRFSDNNIIRDFLLFCLKNKQSLGSYEDGNTNKLIALAIAKQHGLTIPETLLSTKKDDFVKFTANNTDTIIKTLSLPFHFSIPDIYTVGTAKMNEDSISNMPNNYFPTLFQYEIKKEFEIRVFFIAGKCYSMAIFSQSNPKTVVDFRNYDYSKPNRTVPYDLPTEIEDKIALFMNAIGLDTGSLDFIYDKEGAYIFLEVNPVGQYGIVSRSCNYNLNKVIALNLINEK